MYLLGARIIVFYQYQNLWELVSLSVFDSCSQGLCMWHPQCCCQLFVTKLMNHCDEQWPQGQRTFSGCWLMPPKGVNMAPAHIFALLSSLSLIELSQLNLVSATWTNTLLIWAHPQFNFFPYGNLAKGNNKCADSASK